MTSRIPVVFLPGLLNDAALWQPQIQALGDQIAPYVADLTQHDTMQALAAEVLARAPQQFALAGLSMGGYVAFEIMRQAPERVLRLCLCDTSARPDTPEQTERRKMLLALAKSGKFKGVTPRLLPQLIHADHLENAAMTATIIAMAERIGREGFLRQQTAIMNRVDSRPDLPNISCTTQVICGRDDKLTPVEVMREISHGITNSHFAVVGHAGHLSPLEQPETVTRLIKRWLER